MKIGILWFSPNDDGLTAACVAAAQQGIRRSGGEVETVKVHAMGLRACQACGDGWGSCRTVHRCILQDGFTALQDRLREMDAYIFVTPVYWGEMAECAKSLLDRLRRCEAGKGEESLFFGKVFLSVAAAGGTGNGTLTCLAQMERTLRHMGAKPLDFIAIGRVSREYKLAAVEGAAYALASGQPGMR